MLAILNFMYNGEVNVNQGGNLHRESSQIMCHQSTELRYGFGKMIFFLNFFKVSTAPKNRAAI